MKRRAGGGGIVGAVGVAMVQAVASRAGDVSNEQVFKTHCADQAGERHVYSPVPGWGTSI